MSARRRRGLPLLLVLACCMPWSDAWATDRELLEHIAGSIPARESDWKLEPSDSTTDDSQRSFRWTDGRDSVGVTVVLHATLADAKTAFATSPDDPIADLRISGIGNEAVPWPSKVLPGGATNLRFRLGRAEIWVSGSSEARVRRFASHLIAALSQQR